MLECKIIKYVWAFGDLWSIMQGLSCKKPVKSYSIYSVYSLIFTVTFILLFEGAGTIWWTNLDLYFLAKIGVCFEMCGLYFNIFYSYKEVYCHREGLEMMGKSWPLLSHAPLSFPLKCVYCLQAIQLLSHSPNSHLGGFTVCEWVFLFLTQAPFKGVS